MRRLAWVVTVVAVCAGAAARADAPASQPAVVIAPNEEELAAKAAAEDRQRRRLGESDSERLRGLLRPRWALDIGLAEGLAQDTTGVHTMILGGLVPLADTHLALEAQILADSWTRWDPNLGVHAYGFGASAGVRVNPFQRQLRGVSLDVGGIYLYVVDGGTKRISTNGFGITPLGNQAIALRAGLAYGFATTRRITMVVHLDANWWFLDVVPFAPEFQDPYPRPIVLHAGLEFLIWGE